MKRLDGKVAIITGGGSGQGKAAAKIFAAEGAKVIIAEWDEKGGQEVEREIKNAGFEAKFIKTDVSVEDSVKSMIEETMSLHGTVDVLFNNAGIGYSSNGRYKMASILDTSLKEWNEVIGINLNGMYLCSKYVLPIMINNKKGSIVNNSSLNGIVGEPGADAYTATKGAIVALTRVMAVDYGKYNIRVNCICPGGIDTPMIAPAKDIPGFAARFDAMPLKRLGQPEEIGYAALFLASDEASYVTGLIMPVDGGWYAL